LSWSRSGGLVVIALLGFVAPHVSALVLSACTTAVVVGITAADYAQRGMSGGGEAAESGAEVGP
jgi:hypothetical protein